MKKRIVFIALLLILCACSAFVVKEMVGYIAFFYSGPNSFLTLGDAAVILLVSSTLFSSSLTLIVVFAIQLAKIIRKKRAESKPVKD
ncbi:MAG: hypothetical protein MJ239_00395 [Bacilli bacterium]|nr:hypothetical protein [Bacilli bacterium]